MSARSPLMGLAATLVGGVGIVAVTGAGLHLSSPDPKPLDAAVRGTVQTAAGLVPHAFVTLNTYPDSMAGEHGKSGGAHPGWVSYGPSPNLRVPPHAMVTITINQYDAGESLRNPWFAKVRGTVDGTMTVDGQTQTQTNPDAVGHTFTVHAAPTNQDPLFVNVPLPAVADDAPIAPGSDYPKPISVTFSFLTKGPGTYVWNCEFPCGDGYYAKFGGPMSTRGYMSGTFTVA